MIKDDRIFVRHILESILMAEKYLKNIDKEKFLASPQLIDAIIRRVEIMGEAVKNISKEYKEKNNNVPWRDIADMRNFLIHEYFNVDKKEVWRTVDEDFPLLKKTLKKLLK
jgi:uncharacterized protein with HEPN domain